MSDIFAGINDSESYDDVPSITDGRFELRPVKHEIVGKAVKSFIVNFEVVSFEARENPNGFPSRKFEPGDRVKLSMYGLGDQKLNNLALRKIKSYLFALFSDKKAAMNAKKADGSSFDFVSLANRVVQGGFPGEGERLVKCIVEVQPPSSGNPKAKPWASVTWL